MPFSKTRSRLTLQSASTSALAGLVSSAVSRAARKIMAGRSRRVGESTSQATFTNCSRTAVSYSAAVNTRSTYPLSNRVDSGGVPSISGSERSPPAAICHARLIGFVVVRKNRKGRSRAPRPRP